MKINSRFGPISLDAADLILFPNGLWGLEGCRQWALLADPQCPALAWLQSIDQPSLALPVTSPRRFVAGYQMRVARRELAPLALDDLASVKVLVVVGRCEGGFSLNLKAPLVLNLQRRLGRQVITNGTMPVRYELGKHHTEACGEARNRIANQRAALRRVYATAGPEKLATTDR